MKKIALVFIIFLFAFTSGNNWVEINIDSKLTIEFPQKVEMKNVDGKQIYSYKSEECLFAVVAKNISSKHDLNNQQELTQVYDGVIQGTLNAAKEPHLIYKKDFKNSNVQGKEFSIKSKHSSTGQSMIVNGRVIVYKGTIYNVQCWFLDGDNNECQALKQKFFNSIKIKQ